jgi:hypothetical protein
VKSEYVFGLLLVVLLLGMAGFFAWRQILTLRSLRTADDLSPEDWHYSRTQAWRRLLCSALMLVLAVLLAFSPLVGKPVDDLIDKGRTNAQEIRLPAGLLTGLAVGPQLAAAPQAGFLGNLSWTGIYTTSPENLPTVVKRSPLNPTEHESVNRLALHTISVLVVVLILLGLAGADFLAIRRYGQRHYRQIQKGRRAMIEEELARLRSRRNGQG